jgi:hypothetical protein
MRAPGVPPRSAHADALTVNVSGPMGTISVELAHAASVLSTTNNERRICSHPDVYSALLRDYQKLGKGL